MLNALEFRVTDSGVEVGIFDEDEAPKAYGHNTGFKGHPTLANKGLERQFIPDEDQDFKQSITSKIKEIIKLNTVSEPESNVTNDLLNILGTFDNAPLTSELAIESLAGDIISELFGDLNG